MNNKNEVIKEIEEQLYISPKEIYNIAGRFEQEMLAGLEGRSSSLKMLPAFVTRPSGKEKGEILALDFGGSNIRVALVQLLGDGQFKVIDNISASLRDYSAGREYISKDSTARELFAFQARLVREIVQRNHCEKVPLAYTFSFPSRQDNIRHAELINWSKEIDTPGVEGHNVVQLLKQALQDYEMDGLLETVAVINDTVGTLLTAAYGDRCTDIASILGTGHNSCYIEPGLYREYKDMIVNTESGNFNKLAISIYDRLLDKDSKQPGKQLLEKQVAGHYMGELFRLILSDLIKQDKLLNGIIPPSLSCSYTVKAEDLSLIIGDNSLALDNVDMWLKQYGVLLDISREELMIIKDIASIISLRSARLVAATFIGILKHIDPEVEHSHSIAVDGSLYEKMPFYAANLKTALNEALGADSRKVTIKLAKNGSAIGAAIAAAAQK